LWRKRSARWERGTKRRVITAHYSGNFSIEEKVVVSKEGSFKEKERSEFPRGKKKKWRTQKFALDKKTAVCERACLHRGEGEGRG